MIRNQSSSIGSRQTVETSENARKQSDARNRCAKSATATLAAAGFVAITLLAVGCTEEVVESEPQKAVAPKPEIRTVQQQPPREDPPLDGKEFRLQRKRDWWDHAREMLFTDIELSEEQTREVDAIIENQLKARTTLQRLDAKFTAARKTQDAARIKAAREEFRTFKDQFKQPHEIYEEMRAVLPEEQRPAFDMNRARHIAEMQGSGRSRPDERAERAEQE